jgi:hypothetical protein
VAHAARRALRLAIKNLSILPSMPYCREGPCGLLGCAVSQGRFPSNCRKLVCLNTKLARYACFRPSPPVPLSQFRSDDKTALAMGEGEPYSHSGTVKRSVQGTLTPPLPLTLLLTFSPVGRLSRSDIRDRSFRAGNNLRVGLPVGRASVAAVLLTLNSRL